MAVVVTDEGKLIAGRYRLASRLGSGAMGVVWQAHDERLHRTVAIKQVLLPSALRDIEAEEANRRAMREGRITARLHHPHAIAVFDVVEYEGQPFLIMEYLPSRSLATVLSIQGVLPPDTVARIGSQIASALAAAHVAGIIHRDIKPGNVLLADDGTAKITDFGISHAVGDVTVTATGMLAGTPAYLAPEVAQGNSAGFPSDVFSLGSTLYTALEGTPPFGLNTNAIALLHQVALGEIAPPKQSGPLIPLLLRLLQRNPEQRPTMSQAHDALATLAADLAGSRGGLAAPTLPISQNDPPFERVPTTQPTLLEFTPPQQTPIKSAPPQEMRTTVASTNEDATVGKPPTGSDRDGSPRHRRRGLLTGIMAIVLLAAGVLATVLISNGKVTSGAITGVEAAHPSGSSGGPAGGRPTVPTPSRSRNPAQVIAPATPGNPQATPATPATPGSPQEASEQPQQAITDYYALIPENLAVAWQRLTANYQQNHAGGFTGYQNFWNSVQRVTVFDVSAMQGGTVDATIDYFFKDGRVIEEHTSYGLLAEDGLWKINSSTVRSSQTKEGS
ncbi:MAG: eukaryotic-like serine/threonine-protein kinase [Pseudonocardiales bacterium]|nr:eukaryotic-like serine/threonine-protein kinase [Pseudonocardiales bacterium]